MSIPPPPGYKPPVTATAATSLPPTPTPPERSTAGMLTETEASFILDTTLKPAERADGSILAFIDEFIKTKNIAQASEAAGVTNKIGYSYRHRSTIALAIQRLIDKSNVKHGFDSSEIMERTKEIVDFDPIQVQNPDGTFKDNFHDIPPEARRNIKKLKAKNIYEMTEDQNGMPMRIITGRIIEYEFYDKLKAVELTGKEVNLFKTTSVVEHKHSIGMSNLLLESKKRGENAAAEYKNVVETTAMRVPVKETIQDAEVVEEDDE